VKRGCGDDEINLGVGMAGLSALLHQQAPSVQSIFGERQNSPIKHWA
jgi:hypothetical protein